MKFLDQSGLVIVQSWINNSFAKVDQAFGTISYAGNVSDITVRQASTTTNGSPSTVYYDTTSGQFVLKANNNVYFNNWPNKYVWVVPGIDEPWGCVIYKDLSLNKLYKYLPEKGRMTACDVTDYPAMRLRDLLADIEMYIAQKSAYAPSQHTHSIANITGLQAKLDTINKGLTVLGLGQWGAVKVDGVLTNPIKAAHGISGDPTAIYIAQAILSGLPGSDTISGIVGRIGSSYGTVWTGTSVPHNLYVKVTGNPYYSKYYYTVDSNGLPNAVYRWNGKEFTIDEDYSDHSISDGFGKDLEDIMQMAMDYADTASAESVSRKDAVTHSAISSTSSTVRLAYVLSSASTHGNIKSASASELGLVNGVSSSGTGNVVTSMSKAANSSSITWERNWVEPWTTNEFKHATFVNRIAATEGKFSVLDFRSAAGMYLGFDSPYDSTVGLNHHWKGVIMKKAGQAINIARPPMISTDSIIVCNVSQQQIVSGTNFYFDAYTTTATTSTSHDTLVLILQPVTNTIDFSA